MLSRKKKELEEVPFDKGVVLVVRTVDSTYRFNNKCTSGYGNDDQRGHHRTPHRNPVAAYSLKLVKHRIAVGRPGVYKYRACSSDHAASEAVERQLRVGLDATCISRPTWPEITAVRQLVEFKPRLYLASTSPARLTFAQHQRIGSQHRNVAADCCRIATYACSIHRLPYSVLVATLVRSSNITSTNYK